MIRKMYDNVLDTAFPHALPPPAAKYCCLAGRTYEHRYLVYAGVERDPLPVSFCMERYRMKRDIHHWRTSCGVSVPVILMIYKNSKKRSIVI